MARFWNSVKIDEGATVIRTATPGYVVEGVVTGAEQVGESYAISMDVNQVHEVPSSVGESHPQPSSAGKEQT